MFKHLEDFDIYDFSFQRIIEIYYMLINTINIFRITLIKINSKG